MELTEQTVLNCLFSDEEYVRKTLPFIEREYFVTESNKVIFDMVQHHIEKYNTNPTRDSLLISLDELNVGLKSSKMGVKSALVCSSCLEWQHLSCARLKQLP